ncbi:MAG: tripartite tricarboxylate transporter substrate binding protein [Burkholderiales bacterium]|nr:tripartite tricarboxylate transporter substrate binding protein [Burkholderiales bacterium]
MKTIRKIAIHALAIWFAALAVNAVAQTYPARQIRWVVSYPPGGGTDFLARTVGNQIAKQISQSVVIDNRPGGAGVIASETVARSPGDGYTVFTGDNGTLVYNAALFKKIPYAPLNDFAPVGLMARFPLILLANNDAPFANAQALIEQIKRNPAKLSYASPGVGSPHHLAMELFKQRAGLFVVHVPYRGSAGAIQDLISGQIPLFVADSAAALPMIRAKKLKPVAVFSKNRVAALPDTPTFVELGYRDVEAYGWQGLVAPAGTPKDVVAKLNTEMVKAIQAPEIAGKLVEFGLELTPSTPDEMGAYLASETKLWHQLIKERGLTLD